MNTLTDAEIKAQAAQIDAEAHDAEAREAYEASQKHISKCCKAPIKVVTIPDVMDEAVYIAPHIGTAYYKCTKCNQPCDIILLKNEK